MQQSVMPPAANSEVELPGASNPVVLLLAFVPLTLMVLIAVALVAGEARPLPLIALLVLVCCCSGALSFIALQSLLPGKAAFDSEGMTVSRFLAETKYPWSSIESCKVMNATGTFGDDPLADGDQRAGVGLFVRDLKRTRAHALDADVILCAGSKGHLQPLMQVAAKVDAALKWSQMPQRRGASRPVPSSAAMRAQRQTRQKSKTASKVDPVAQFRNRSGPA